MSNPADSERITAACPHCGKRFVTSAANVGKTARCPACAQPFTIAAATAASAVARGAAAAVAPGAASKPAAAKSGVCAICQSPFAPGEATTRCTDCKSLYHQDCWEYNKGCAVYGCPQAPPTEKLTDLEIPASHWGREDKNCPNCGRSILAAAVRCRWCGATFDSADPQATHQFRAKQEIKYKIPGVKKASIWLLVLSILPCTAPLAAVGGPIWYLANRKVIAAMPGMNAAMCKIAVGVAIAQTAMLAFFFALYGIVHG